MTTNTSQDPAGEASSAGTPADLHLSALTAALQDSPSPVIIIDALGRVVFVNEAFAAMTGYPSEQYSGIALGDLEGGVGKYAKDEVWEAFRAGESYSGRYWAQRGEGEVYWLQTDASAIRDEKGEIAHVLVIARELSSVTVVTPPGLGETPAVPSGVSPDLVLVADLHGTIQFTSWTVPGLKREDVIGASVFDFVPPEERERLQMYIDRVIETGRSVHYEIDAVGPHGSASRYVTQLGPVEHEGAVVAFSFASYAVDKPARNLDGGAEARLRALANAAVEGVAIHDNGVILDANEVMAEMYGYDSEDVVGRHVREFAAPESRAAVLARVLAKEPGPYEAVGLRKDGSTFPVEICAKEVTYGGRLVRAAAIRDTSGRRSAPAQQIRRGPPVRRRGQAPKALDLSERELEVLTFLARGLTNRQLAAQLGVSRRTIDHHVSHILGKLQAPNRLAAVNLARSKGLLRGQAISKR